MSYHDEMKQLAEACDFAESALRKPVKIPGQIKPLTAKERRKVEQLSSERGYRRLTAEYMTRA